MSWLILVDPKWFNSGAFDLWDKGTPLRMIGVVPPKNKGTPLRMIGVVPPKKKQSSYSGWIGLRFLCGSTSLILSFSESTQLQEATTLTEQCVDVSKSSRSCPDRQDQSHTPYTPFIPSLRGQGSQNFTVVYPFWLWQDKSLRWIFCIMRVKHGKTMP